jgi:cell wall-associated protease
MKQLAFLIAFLISLSMSLRAQAQSAAPDSIEAPPFNWFLLDPESDRVQGISMEKAYAELLKNKPARKIIVAVIDTGIDIEHEDLKGKIWTNADEIPNNGIDDDKNGYADDVHGWNFIGGKNGNVVNDHAEVTREYMRLKPLYEDASKVSKKNKGGLAYWKKVQEKYDRDSKANQKKLEEYQQQLHLYSNALFTIAYCDSIAKRKLNVAAITLAEVKALPADNDTLQLVKRTLESVFENTGEGVNLNEFIEELDNHVLALNDYVENLKAAVLSYDLTYKPRDIVGDQTDNISEKNYGNNDVSDVSKHGTHVAGIIAANRENSLGMKGVANQVEVMPIKVVPASGDERDKDVANGIVYAVDNGASIINMSFGKYFSPDKLAVEKAVRYAEQKGVLLVHAAGNDGDDIDTKDHFPVPDYSNGKQAGNWIEVGASSWGTGKNFVADFSNYGKKTVDVFSPGTEIYATTPANTYESLQGTSMATPVVAGVAAVLLSYFPELTVNDVREIISLSSRKFENLKVNRPGSTSEVEFRELSKSGGLINAYEAIKLASTWKAKSIKK